jgi:aminoglycoside 6'-N-acetyltransferase
VAHPDQQSSIRPELRGPRLALSPVSAEHLPRLRELHLLPQIRRWWLTPAAEWPFDEPGAVPYAICVNGAVIGFIQWYAEEDPAYRHAGIDIFLDPAWHGQGLGTEAVAVMCAHLIDDLGHHRVIIDPAAANEAAIRSYRKVGFKPVGVLRQYTRREDGAWEDGLLMDLLADELVRTG